MAKKNISGLDKARKSFLKGLKAAGKSAQKSQRSFARGLNKKAKEVSRARNNEYVLRWRELKKLGLVNTKKPPALKNLTSSIKTKINKEFFDLQRAGVYDKGVVRRPLQKVSYVTPSGKKKEKYELGNMFKFLRTKKKTKTQTGVFKTSKGYLIQKRSSDAKVSINKKGEVVQKVGKMVFRTKGYKGTATLKLLDDIEKGKFKLKPRQYLSMRMWGSDYVNRLFAPDGLEFFVEMLYEYKTEMNPTTFNSFLDLSDVTIIDNAMED